MTRNGGFKDIYVYDAKGYYFHIEERHEFQILSAKPQEFQVLKKSPQ